MTSFGNTVFGDLANFAVPSSTSAKVGITSNNPISLDVKGGNTAGIQVDSSILGIKITSSNTGADIVAKVKGIKIAVSDGSDTFGAEIETTGNTNSSGIKIFSKAIVSALGVDAIAVNGTTSNIGVLGKTLGQPYLKPEFTDKRQSAVIDGLVILMATCLQLVIICHQTVN